MHKKYNKLEGVPLLVKNAIAPLEKYLNMDDISEICINEPLTVFVEHSTGWKEFTDENLTLETLKTFAEFLATYSQQVFNDNTPMLATHIPSYGYRVQIIGGMSDTGIGISIRVGTAKKFPLESYMSLVEANKVRKAIKDKKTIIVSGGTGTGKTTMINNLISLIDESERIFAIEDTKELIIPHRNQMRLLKSKSNTDSAKINYEHIIDSVLRMRPDRIIVGEITIENTMPFLKIINTGHAGSLTSIHANSETDVIHAISMNALMSPNSTDNSEVTAQYTKRSVDAILHLKRKSRNKITASYYELSA